MSLLVHVIPSFTIDKDNVCFTECIWRERGLIMKKSWMTVLWEREREREREGEREPLHGWNIADVLMYTDRVRERRDPILWNLSHQILMTITLYMYMNKLMLSGNLTFFQMCLHTYYRRGSRKLFQGGGGPTLSKIDSVWRITVEVHKYEK